MIPTCFNIYRATLILLILPLSKGVSQQNNLPYNRSFLLNIEKHLAHPDNQVHTAVKPYIEYNIKYDSIVKQENHGTFKGESRTWLTRKIKYESLIQVDTGDFKLQIDPLLDFSYSRDLADASLRADTSSFYNNSRGFRISGSITKKFSFETNFLETQSFFVNYINDYVQQWGVVPGQGRVKDFKKTGFDYAWASGNISYSPVQNVNVQFGHGKHFIGEGYRSLFLSDNAFVYPFLKINTSFFRNRFNYTNIFSSLQTLRRMKTQVQREELFVRKNGTFHFLSWNISRRIQIGIFEGIIWKASDNNYPQKVNPLFYNPLMLVNSFALLNDTSNNVFTGIHIKYKVLKKTTFYGQLLLNGLKADRYGIQAGLKTFDLFNVNNLHFQVEFNSVEPYMYAFHNPVQNYAHYNQSLASPLGAGFKEAIVFADYGVRDLFIGLKMNFAVMRSDTAGGSIFVLDSQSPVYDDPLKSKLLWQELSFGYIINRKSNMKLMAGIIERVSSNPGTRRESRILFLSLRTDLFNRYYDF